MPSPLLKGYIEVASAAILFGTIGIFVSLVSQMPIGSTICNRAALRDYRDRNLLRMLRQA